MFKKFYCRFCKILEAIWQYNPQHKCSKRGGVKGRLNNVKKNRRFGPGGRPFAWQEDSPDYCASQVSVLACFFSLVSVLAWLVC